MKSLALKKIDYISDLHLEYQYRERVTDKNKDDKELSDFFNKLIGFPKKKSDVLVVAGDVATNIWLIEEFLTFTLNHYKKVIYVMGNHEHYLTDAEKTIFADSNIKIAFIKRRFELLFGEKVVILDESITEYEGVRFGGATMWSVYRKGSKEYKRYVERSNDYQYASLDINKKGRSEKKWYDKNKQNIDVLVTHVPPVLGKTHEYFNNTTGYYTPLEDLPPIVICGHTHEYDIIYEQNSEIHNNSVGFVRQGKMKIQQLNIKKETTSQ